MVMLRVFNPDKQKKDNIINLGQKIELLKN